MRYRGTRYSVLAAVVAALGLMLTTGSALAQEDYCQKGITLTKIERLDGQGFGEGQLEVTVEAGLPARGVSKTTPQFKLSSGEVQMPKMHLETLRVPLGKKYEQVLRTKVVEHEVGKDKFVGGTDRGSAKTKLKMECGKAQETVSQEIKIKGRNTGKVRVEYTIGESERRLTTKASALESANTRAVVIDSDEVSGGTSYTLITSPNGNIEKVEKALAGFDVSKNANDTIDGNKATGQVGVGSDGYIVRGDIPLIHLDNPRNARVYVDGKRYHTVVIDSSDVSGKTGYTVHGGGELTQVMGPLGNFQLSIQGNDSVNGDRATGQVNKGTDGFTVLGDIPKIDLDDPQNAKVYVDGLEYHAVVVDGSAAASKKTDYTIKGAHYIEQVDGKVYGHNASIQPNDTVKASRAEGAVGVGTDAFRLIGDLPATPAGQAQVSINLDNSDAAEIYVDGSKWEAKPKFDEQTIESLDQPRIETNLPLEEN